jgi:hypothetical protein
MPLLHVVAAPSSPSGMRKPSCRQVGPGSLRTRRGGGPFLGQKTSGVLTRREEAGLGLLEVVIAITLFMILLVPAAEFLVGGVRVTGQQRAKAIAAQLAAQQPTGATSTLESISGIRFIITSSTSPPTCKSIASTTSSTSSIEVPMERTIVTVTWGAHYSYTISRWKPSPSNFCPLPNPGAQP